MRLRLAYKDRVGMEVYEHEDSFSIFFSGQWEREAYEAHVASSKLVHVIPHADQPEDSSELARLKELAIEHASLGGTLLLPDMPEVWELIREARMAAVQLLRVEKLTNGEWVDTGERKTQTEALGDCLLEMLSETFDSPYPVEPRRLVWENGHVATISKDECVA